MTSSSFAPPLITIIFYISFYLFRPATCCYESIYSFGDSLTDTGNQVLSPAPYVILSTVPPYGETYFGRPNGRFSDGRLIVDFIAEAMELPLLPPFLGGDGNGDGFRHGVNFATGGATALDNDFFRKKGLFVYWTNYSLSVQLEWFKQVRSCLCTSDAECEETFNKSLFLVGEIGGNDYNEPLWEDRSLDVIKSTYVPLVIDAIASTIIELIALGARTLIVPGNFPIGCTPGYLTQFQTDSEDDYDKNTGCIKWLNEFSEYHNLMLQQELDRLRRLHPSATLIYADYYNATMSIYRSPTSFGFDETLVACCGAGGPYNNKKLANCGTDQMTNLCDDPSKYVSWDGVHFTEATYRAITNMLLDGPFAMPAINYKCQGIKHKVDKKQEFF